MGGLSISGAREREGRGEWGRVHRAQEMMWRRISSGSVSSWVGRPVSVWDSVSGWVSSSLVTMAVRLWYRVRGGWVYKCPDRNAGVLWMIAKVAAQQSLSGVQEHGHRRLKL